MLNHSLKTGFSFGLTSGIITTLGLIMGLYSGTHSKIAVLGGIFTIAIADALSDAFGIHISEESELRHSSKEIWLSTVSTFLAKLVFALTFIIPILLFPLFEAVVASIIWGLFLLSTFSFYIAKQQNKKSWRIILEHLAIALVVIILTHYAGVWIGKTFGS